MTMKMIFACLMVLFFTPFLVGVEAPVFAQVQPTVRHQLLSAADIVAMMQSKLNLTQDQVAAVTPIIEKYSPKRRELRQSMKDGVTDRRSMISQMKQLRADENQELSQVLSAAQMSQWEHHGRLTPTKQSSEGGVNGVKE